MIKASSLPNLDRILEDNAMYKPFPARRSSLDVSDQGKVFLMSRSMSPWDITENAGSARSVSLNQEQVGRVSHKTEQEQVDSVNHSKDQELVDSVNHFMDKEQLESVNHSADRALMESINRDFEDLILNQVDDDNPQCEVMEEKFSVRKRYSAIKLSV